MDLAHVARRLKRKGDAATMRKYGAERGIVFVESAELTTRLAVDAALYGVAYVDAQGQRIDPCMVHPEVRT